jgi:hypothetical protein
MTLQEKANQIYITLGKTDGEKHILQCLYLVDLNYKLADNKLADNWNEILNAFYILTQKEIKDENKGF